MMSSSACRISLENIDGGRGGDVECLGSQKHYKRDGWEVGSRWICTLLGGGVAAQSDDVRLGENVNNLIQRKGLAD